MTAEETNRCNLKPTGDPHIKGSTEPYTYKPGEKQQRGNWVGRTYRCERGCPFGGNGRRVPALALAGPHALDDLNRILKDNQNGCNGERRREDYFINHP